MEGILCLMLFVGIVALVIWSNSNEAKRREQNSVSPVALGEHTLKLRVNIKPEFIAGSAQMSLEFESKGVLSPNFPLLRPSLELTLVDVTPNTNGQGRSILTVIDDLQAADSNAFKWAISFPKPLDVGAGAFDWVSFGAIPLDALIFPEGGARTIKAVLTVRDLSTGRTSASADFVFPKKVEAGYLELELQEGEAQAACLKLAMCLAAADGVVDDEEVDVIKKWGEKSVKALDADAQSERHQLLNTALQEATQALRTGKLGTLREDAINDLNELGEPRYKYDAYELCLHVLKADGQAHPEEMASVTAIGKKLGLDENKVRWLTDRHTADVEFTVVYGEDGGDDHFLGITPDMNKDEIKSHLNKLFKKHSARSTHDDPKVAAKAREWLDRIGKARVRHLG
jgi:uncharacterized tellurite resistance protein B-like protein